jgi:hypothetical protein
MREGGQVAGESAGYRGSGGRRVSMVLKRGAGVGQLNSQPGFPFKARPTVMIGCHRAAGRHF